MNAGQLFRDYGVDVCPSGNKHYRNGWVNINCPFCSGSMNYHLGYNLSGNYFNCFRCGFKSEIKVIAKVLNIPYREALNIHKKYQGGRVVGVDRTVIVKKKKFKMPSNIKEIAKLKGHQIYLERRGFNWKKLVKMYDIKGTGAVSNLGEIDFGFRIIIPIFYDGQQVSWQTRSIAKKSKLKYISCSKEREVIEHKTILYQTPPTDYIVLCEGVFDVWKVNQAGFEATCCFGIEYKQAQINHLKKYARIAIFFDEEVQAQVQAKKVKRLLDFSGSSTVIVEPTAGEDPGSMNKEQIKDKLRQFR